MKVRTIVSLLLALAFILPLTVRADQDKDQKIEMIAVVETMSITNTT
jgi:hypothetical protein